MGYVITLPALVTALRGLVSSISARAILRFITGTPEARYAEALLAIMGASAAPGMILPSFGDRVDEELPHRPKLLGKLRHRISSFHSAHMAVSRIVRTFYIVYLISQTHLDQLVSK
jgi:hypothetical protein